MSVDDADQAYRPIPVDEAKTLSSLYAKPIVVVISADDVHERLGVTSFGRGAGQAVQAARLADYLMTLIGDQSVAPQIDEDFRQEYDAALLRLCLQLCQRILTKHDGSPYLVREAEKILKQAGMHPRSDES